MACSDVDESTPPRAAMARVLLLCEYPSLNGGERSLLAVTKYLRAGGYQLVVACPDRGPLVEAVRRAGLQHVPLVLHDARQLRYPLPRLREKLCALIEDVDPDLVHANSVSMSRLSGPATVRSGRPSIGHLRDMIRLSAQAIADLNGHHRLLAVSQATRRWYGAAGLETRNVSQNHVREYSRPRRDRPSGGSVTGCKKSFVSYNGVDLDLFQPRKPTGWLHRELQLPLGVSLVGAIGQIGMRKGLDVLCEAATTVTRQRPDVHYVLVGQRYSAKEEAVAFERSLHAVCGQAPLVDRVHFLGVRSDVPRILNELTLLVHAARQEPLGRVLLEAAASGVPIVATDVGGTREIFPDETRSALLVPPDAPDRLAQAIETLLDSSARRHQLALAARHRAVNCFSAHAAAHRLMRHYAEVLDGA